jgi:peptide/nickel transport system substrate-binding protein
MHMKNTSCSIPGGRARGIALALMLLAALPLGGCAGPKTNPSASVQVTATASIAATEVPQPKSGGSITLPMPADTKSENPLLVSTREMSSVYALMFEGLLQITNGTPTPCLAENWTASPDGLQYTFTLRKGAKWQSSKRALEAKDVLFTLDQIRALGSRTTYRYVLDWVESWQEGTNGTVTLKLKKPFYGALHALTFPILPYDGGYNSDTAPEIPVGTGPYACVSFLSGKSIKLEANSDWWMKPPYISSIEVLPYADNATAIKSLVLRQLDAVQTNDRTVLQYRESGDANVYEYATHFFEYIALNNSMPDLQDKRMRQAIAYAIDRREVVAWAYSNHAIVADTPVPPDSWLYDGKVLHYNKDVGTAKKLIEQAGWKDTDGDGIFDLSPDGVIRKIHLTLLANREENDTLRYDAAKLIADQLNKAGFEVEVVMLPWDQYNTTIKEKHFDLAMCGTYLSPVPDYSFLLRSDGALNSGGWGSGDMDKLLDEISTSSDSKVLALRMADLQTSIIENLPIISLYFRTHSLLTAPKVRGVSGAGEESAFANISEWFIAP